MPWYVLYFLLVLLFRCLIFMNFFHSVNIAIKQQQYCTEHMIRPQINSDRHKNGGPKGCP